METPSPHPSMHLNAFGISGLDAFDISTSPLRNLKYATE